MYSTQKQLIKEQDDHLNEIGEIAIRLHDHAKNIDQELGKQKELNFNYKFKKIMFFRLIDQLDANVDKTQNKMNFVQKKLSQLLKTSGFLTYSLIKNLVF